MYFLVAEGPMLLSRVTAHKITTFRCKYLTTMATGDDNDNNKDGATTTTMMTKMAMARRATGYNDDWWRTLTTTRSMATARGVTMMATLVIIIY